MITNFEHITRELSADEKKLLPIIIKGLLKKKVINPVKAPEIVSGINTRFGRKVISQARLRKLINLIRSKGIIPVIATSRGYYVSYDKEVIKSQVRSLNERAEAIVSAADGLKKFLT